MRKFIYLSDWTVPIDEIKRVKVEEKKVIIVVDGRDLYENSNNPREVYEDIQRQLAEAERS